MGPGFKMNDDVTIAGYTGTWLEPEEAECDCDTGGNSGGSNLLDETGGGGGGGCLGAGGGISETPGTSLSL